MIGNGNITNFKKSNLKNKSICDFFDNGFNYTKGVRILLINNV